MKKARKPSETSLDRYDWSRARRGHWAGRVHTGKAVLVPAELYARFGTDEAIVRTLEAVLEIRDAVPPQKKKRGAA